MECAKEQRRGHNPGDTSTRQEPYRDRTMREAWTVRNGYLEVPDRPGLGVELDEEALLSSPPRLGSIRRDAFASDGSVVDV